MERSSTVSSTEVVAVALAAASALGGVLVGLSRAQANAAREELLARRMVEANPTNRLNVALDRIRQSAGPPSLPSLPSLSSPQLRQSATQFTARLNESASPALERLAQSAAAQAEATRRGGATLRGKLHDAVESFSPAATDAVNVVKHRADRAVERSSDVGPVVTSTAALVAERATRRSTALVGDTVAAVGWVATATALVYFLLLTPERREQLSEALATASEQLRLLIQDFRGYEEEL